MGINKAIILFSAFFCLLCCPSYAYEVKTRPQDLATSADRVHYPLFAQHFCDTLKTHPPVSDCQVLLQKSGVSEFADNIEIAIKIDKEHLIAFLTNERKVLLVSQKDQDRYLTSLQFTIRKTASEIFTDIKHEAIKVSVSYVE